MFYGELLTFSLLHAVCLLLAVVYVNKPISQYESLQERGYMQSTRSEL